MPKTSLYLEKYVLGRPMLTIMLLVLITGYFATYTNHFRLDASADTLVLENDQSLQYYRSIRARYGSDDALVVTYTPKKDLFATPSLSNLEALQTELTKIEGIKNVTSILNVPLVASPKTTLSELRHKVLTLASPEVDKPTARTEFLTSPIYKDLLLSADGQTTAMLLNIERDEEYFRLLSIRDKLREQRLLGTLTPEQEVELDVISIEFYQYSATLQNQQAQMIQQVRQVLDKHRSQASLFLGGVPMITADSIEFIANDLVVFGIGVLIFLIITLVVAFNKPRWVILPLVTCFAAGVIMLGLLGLLDWPVTVVSANFISLMLIITLSLTIHLIVRYQELHAEYPNAEQYWLVLTTLKKKFLPCIFTAVTTMVAFGSLLFSFIRPVIDFGWMMTIGMAVAFVLSFTLFPAMLLLFKPGQPASQRNLTGLITQVLSKKIEAFPRIILLSYLVLALLSVWGISRLSVENRFIDYYRDSTEIYQGMELIDKKLGGTTPLDVIIDAPKWFYEEQKAEVEDEIDPEMLEELGMDMDDFDFYDEEGEADQAGITGNSYWFNVEQLKQVSAIHQYLEQLPQTGKVLSIASTMAMLKPLDPVVANDNFYLAILYKELPESIKSTLISPYLAQDGNQIRFSIRVFESDSNLKRDELLATIRHDLKQEFNLKDEQIHLSGMVVLYNNMLQSLFQSQILTIGVVFMAILFMFIILFKNWRVATIALVPNVVAAGLVLGVMGLLSIPLDLMTITIAAICIGIAVDDSIHYVHRFQIEFKKDQDYWAAVRRSHTSIGRAMYYTSLTITLGFSILALSNFVPTMYFGLLTGFSMIVALLANLTLLPLLMVKFRPLPISKS
mgnify:CR=1 FL=1